MIQYKAIFISLIFLTPMVCLAQDSLLFQSIKENSYHLEIENQELSGSSLPLIQKAIKESQFLMVGEQHGIKEVSEFVTALSKKSFEEGFEYLCIETDPYISNKLESLALENIDSINSFIQHYPFVIPFYDTKEEFELIRNFKSGKSNSNESIWGVDQIYMATPRFAFSLLEKEAKSDQDKYLISQYSKTTEAQFNTFLKSQNPMELPMLQLNDLDFEKLSKIFSETSDKKASQIIADVQISQEIYKHIFVGENYWNNFKRSKLMKRQFMDYYNRNSQQENLPKIIFKFGAVHMSKGISPVHLYDLGNMVSELAEMNGTTSTNFKITAVKGKGLEYTGAIKPFDNYKSLIPEIKKIYDENEDTDKWIFIDLRSLRSKLSHDNLEKIKDMVFSYDYWIIIPEANPLTKL